MTSKKLTPEEIVSQSGHNHHSKAVAALRGLNWTVTVSPFYSDNFTDKPREIDIIAEKAFPCEDPYSTVNGFVLVRLFIECKFMPLSATTVFWFDGKDVARASELVDREMKWPAGDPRTRALPHELHHLARTSVAKLFASGQSRTDEGEAFARAINQTLNGLIYYRNREAARRVPSARLLGQLTFPLILVNSFASLHRIEMGNLASTPAPIAQPFELEVNYAYRKDEANRDEYFLIDVVSLDSLKAFLASLEQNEVAAMTRHIIREGRENRRRR